MPAITRIDQSPLYYTKCETVLRSCIRKNENPASATSAIFMIRWLYILMYCLPSAAGSLYVVPSLRYVQTKKDRSETIKMRLFFLLSHAYWNPSTSGMKRKI